MEENRNFENGDRRSRPWPPPLAPLLSPLFKFFKNKRVTEDKHFNRLPNEVVVKIFSFLSQRDLTKRICLVNRRFKDISLNSPSLWTKMWGCSKRFDPENAAKFFGRCSMLTVLDLSNEKVSPVPLAIKALKVCSNLNFLIISKIKDDVGGLLLAVGASDSLRGLCMQGQWDPQVISDNANCLQRLLEIALKSRNALDNESLLAIGKHCQSLSKFYLRFEQPWNHTPFNAMAMQNFVAAIKNTIQKLTIIGINLMDEMAYQGLTECQRLTHLEISNATPILLTFISQMLELKWLLLPISSRIVTAADYVETFMNKKLRNLEALEFYGDDAVDDNVLATVAANCPNLIYLAFYMCSSNISDVGLAEVFRKCTKLRELYVVRMNGITSKAFTTNAPMLRKLVINSNPNRQCIDKRQLAAIKKLMPQLVIYDLNTWAKWSYQNHVVQ